MWSARCAACRKASLHAASRPAGAWRAWRACHCGWIPTGFMILPGRARVADVHDGRSGRSGAAGDRRLSCDPKDERRIIVFRGERSSTERGRSPSSTAWLEARAG